MRLGNHGAELVRRERCDAEVEGCEGGTIGFWQFRHGKNGGVTPIGRVLLAKLRFRRDQEIRRQQRTFLGISIVGNGNEMRVAEGAADIGAGPGADIDAVTRDGVPLAKPLQLDATGALC